MSLYPSMQKLIESTPLIRLSQLGFPEQLNICARLELYNPTGSVKDQIGRSMIADAESRDILRPGSTIIEATVDNTGLGIAFAALSRGYRLIFVVPQKFSQEEQALMEALDAEIIHTLAEEGMLDAARKAEELRTEIANFVFLEQFENRDNPQAHCGAIGPEICRDLGGRIDYVVADAGSSGIYTGALRYLKEQNPATRSVLVSPIGSTVRDGEHSSYEIEDIGNDFIADTMDMSLVDQVIRVSDVEAFEQVRVAAKKKGIFAGSPSGTALTAVNKLTETVSSETVVVILPNRGKRYFSKHTFDEQTFLSVSASTIHR